MLYDFNNPQKYTPYYSQIENTPQYQKQKAWSDKSAAIRGGFMTLFNTVASIIPGSGVITGAANKGIANAGNKIEEMAWKPIYKNFQKQLEQGQKVNTTGALPSTQDGQNDTFSALAKALAGIRPQPTQDNQFEAMDVGRDVTLEQAPAYNQGPEIMTSPTEGTMDWGSSFNGGGESQFSAPTMGFKKGGRIEVGDGYVKAFAAGGGVKVEGGKGDDDIALVEEKTGKDTGVRVSKGEMLVVSEKNLAALHKAIKKGDKNEVFKIMHHQVKQEPEVKQGTEGYKKGGPVNIEATDDDGKKIVFEENITVPKTYEELKSRFDYLQSVLGKGGFGSLFKGTNVNSKDYEKAVDKLTKEYERLAPIVSKTYREKGVGPIDQAYFSKFQYKEAPKGIQEGAELPLKNTGLSSPEELVGDKAVYKDGKWTMRDKSGNYTPLPDDHQEDYTNAYSKPKDTGVQYGYSIPDVVITPTDNKPVEQVAQPDSTPGGLMNSDIYNLQNTPMRDKEIPISAPPVRYFDETNYQPTKVADVNIPEQEQVKTGNLDWKDLAGNALGYGYDIFRGIEGFKGANTLLPKFTKPTAWNDYMQRLKTQSYGGLSAPEMARLQTDADRTYAYDVANIYNLSGGNAGMALGNLGRAATSKYGNELNIAAMDRQARAQNMSLYGGYLGQDVNLDRTIFTDSYNNALMTKQAGAQLTKDAIENIQQRALTNRYYGPNSYNSRIQEEYLKNLEETNQQQKDLSSYLSKNWGY